MAVEEQNSGLRREQRVFLLASAEDGRGGASYSFRQPGSEPIPCRRISSETHPVRTSGPSGSEPYCALRV
jgi:hypothetical protein